MFDRVVRKTVENNTDYTTRIPTINSVELIDSLNKLGFKENLMKQLLTIKK